MAVSEAFQASVSVTTTEYFLASASTTKTDQTADGVYQLFLELNNLAAGDEFRVRLYERISSAGTARICEEWVIGGAQATPNWITPAFILLHGWEFSLTKLAGTDRSIAWSIRKSA